MTRFKMRAFGVIVVAVGVFLWFALERRSESVAPASGSALSMQVEAESADSTGASERHQQTPVKSLAKSASATNSKGPPDQSKPNELPDFEVPPDQAIARLRVLADAENSDAQIELSRRLAGCTARATRATELLDTFDRQDIQSDQANQEMDEKLRAVRIANTQKRVDKHEAERTACAALPPDVLETWLDPVDQAARSGNTYAMRQYAAFVVAEYDSMEAVVADVDRAIVRRDKARAYLYRAVELGDTEAIVDLARAYFHSESGGPQLYAVDNYQAYVYAYASSFANLPAHRHLDWLMPYVSRSLDPSQIADARKQGKRLYDTCCRKN